MEKLSYSVFIKASKKKVWETMLNDATYRQWTAIFNPSGSYYEGSWNEGSDIRFYGPNEDGTVSGMISRIKQSRPYEYISIQHLGEVINGKEKLWPATAGVEALENYTFKEVDGGTELHVDLDSPPEYKEMFEEMWPKALQKLKEIAENQ